MNDDEYEETYLIVSALRWSLLHKFTKIMDELSKVYADKTRSSFSFDGVSFSCETEDRYNLRLTVIAPKRFHIALSDIIVELT